VIRRHPITGDDILYAPGRAERPNAFPLGARDPRCPFCPGHEADTPPEIARHPTTDAWRYRIVPNKYPAAPGHQVIVESPDHATSFDRIAEPEAVLRASLVQLSRALETSAYASLFKNHGAEAGASIDHVHSQLLPVSWLPPRIVRERDGFMAARCPLCALLGNDADGHLIERTRFFARVAPAGSIFPWQQWIMPLDHRSMLTDLDDARIADLAAVLARASRGMLKIANAYNWMFMLFPGCDVAHAYIDAFPRVTRVAGFELATGSFIDIIDPAVAADRYRTIDASTD
jgi:UDPglucose--hexose-1-phosphate uridylyltransferase